MYAYRVYQNIVNQTARVAFGKKRINMTPLLLIAVLLVQGLPIVFGSDCCADSTLTLLEDGRYASSDGEVWVVPEGADPFEYIFNQGTCETTKGDEDFEAFSSSMMLMSSLSLTSNYLVESYDPAYNIGSPVIDNSGNLWFFRYDSNTQQYTFVKFNTQTEEWERYVYNPNYFGYMVPGSIFDVDSRGNIWCLYNTRIGNTYYVALVEFDPVNNIYVDHSFPIYGYPWLNYMTIDDSDVVWIPNNNPYQSGDNRRPVYSYNPSSHTVKTYLTPIDTNIGRVKIDNSNVPWVPAQNRGTIYKVFFSSTTLQAYTYAGQYLGIREFCFDRDNNIWMTLYNVHLLGYDQKYPLFHYTPSSNYLAHKNVALSPYSLLELDGEGLLWISDGNEKNVKIYDGTNVIYTFPDLQYYILKGVDDAMWVFNFQKLNLYKVRKDATAPTTSIVLEGTLGENDWYTSGVQVSFYADDHVDSGATGLISETAYTIDGVNWVYYYIDDVEEDVPLCSDNFDTTNPDWVPASGLWSIGDGYYLGKRGVHPEAVTYLEGSENWGDFTIDLDMYLDEDYKKNGLRFLDNEQGTYYELYKLQNSIYLRRVVNGQQLANQYISYASAYAWVRIHVEKYGNKIVAGTPTYTMAFIDEYIGTGKIGLFTEASSKEAKFDNFQAYRTSTIDYGPNPFILDIEGVHTVCYLSVDKAGNSEEIKLSEIKIDYTPPITLCQVEGTEGSNGWYISHVTLNLSPVDEISSVELTYIRVDEQPFSEGTSITLEAPGIHTVEYYSVDKAGNTETTNTVTIKINRPPISDAGGPYTGYEGMMLVLDGSGSYDFDGTIVEYSWDLDGDGEYDDAFGERPSLTIMDDAYIVIGLRVRDDLGVEGYSTTSLTILNVAPSVELGSEVTVYEGIYYTGSGSFTDPGEDTWFASVDYGEGPIELELIDKSFTLSYLYMQDGVYTITVKVFDDDGGVGEDTLTVNVLDLAPVADFTWAPEPQEEGSPVQFTDMSTSYPDTIVAWSWSFGDGGSSTEQSPEHVYGDDGVYTVTLMVTDDDGSTDSVSYEVTILNVAPTLGPILATHDPVPVNTAIAASVEFTDPGWLDSHTALWDWGDGSTSAGAVTEESGVGVVTGSHAYIEAGVYTVTLTLTDDDGGTDTSGFQYIVVYDPSGGITGGGWIMSPEGAYTPDPKLTGKATFGFVSKYKKGANVPTGNTEFVFHAGGVRFHSGSYDWLVVAGSNAKFKGVGTINGAGEYGFMLTVTDGRLDTFRIKIWDRSSETVIYDNKLGQSDDSYEGTSLGGGNIVVHK